MEPFISSAVHQRDDRAFIEALMARLHNCKIYRKTITGSNGQSISYVTKSGEARYYIRYWFMDPKTGQRIRWNVVSDLKGIPLASEAQTYSLALQIEEEIAADDVTHNPYKYQPDYKNLWALSRQARLWLDHVDEMVKVGHLSPKTAAKYRSHVENYFIPHFEQRDIKEIRKHHLTEFLKSLSALRAELIAREVARKRIRADRAGEAMGISLKTQKDILNTLATFLNYCASEELLSKAEIPPFPKIRIPKLTPRWVDKAGQEKVLTLVPERHRDMIAFEIMQGFRNGEACELRMKDMNFATAEIRLYHSKTRVEHPVLMHPRAVDMLKRRCAGKLPDAFVFTYLDRFGKEHKYTVQSLFKITKAALITAGMPDVKPYELFKHSKATQAGRAGASAKAMRAYFGWSSDAVSDRYLDSSAIPQQTMHQDNVVELPAGTGVAPAKKSGA